MWEDATVICSGQWARDPRGAHRGVRQRSLCPSVLSLAPSLLSSESLRSTRRVWGIPILGITTKGRTWVAQPRPQHLDSTGPQMGGHQVRARGPCVSSLPPAANLPVLGAPQARGGQGGGREMGTRCAPPCTCRGRQRWCGKAGPGAAPLLSSRLGGPGPAPLVGPRGRGRALGSRARRSALNPVRRPAGMAAAGAR